MASYHGPRQDLANLGDDEDLTFGDSNEYDFVYNTTPGTPRFEFNQGANRVWDVEDGQQGVRFQAGVSLGGADPRDDGLDVGGGDIVDGATTIWDSSTGDIVAPIAGTFANGSAASPSIAFQNDADTGLFRAAANALGIAAGGTEQARWTGSGLNLRSDVDLEGTGADTVVTLDAGNDLVFEDDDGTDRFAIREGGPTEVVAGDLRVRTGGSVEDGGGTNRFQVNASNTTIYDDAGNIAFIGDDGSKTELSGYSSQPIIFRDRQGSFDALTYSTGASAGAGTLTYIGGDIDFEGTGQDTTITLDDTHDLLFRDNAGGGILRLHEDDRLVEVVDGDLRIPTGNVIEDGGGTRRINLGASITTIRDDAGTIAVQYNSGVEYVSLARSSEPWIVRDQEGSFDALKYATAASAPGTLTLDADTFIKDGGQLVVGDTAAQTIAGLTGRLQALGNSINDATVGIANYEASAARPGWVTFGKSRSGTVGTVGTAVQDGDELMEIRVAGDDGTDLNSQAAQIIAAVDNTVATDQVPGRFEFHTADSSGALTEALRIDSAQGVGIGTGSPDARLNVKKDADAVEQVLRLENENSGTSGAVQMWMASNGNNLQLVSYGDGHSSRSQENVITSSAGGTDLVLETVSTEALRLNSSQQTLVTDGSASTPALSFINDTDTGIFSPGADQLAISLGGTAEWNFAAGDLTPDSAGTQNIGTASTYFNEMHAASFITHSPAPREWPEALTSIKEYAEEYGSMEMEEVVADLVAVVKEQQAAIEGLQSQVNPQ